jgi:hypothetical protein
MLCNCSFLSPRRFSGTTGYESYGPRPRCLETQEAILLDKNSFSLTEFLPHFYLGQRPTVFPSEQGFTNSLGSKSFKELKMTQDWEGAYRAAVLETDQHKLMGKIDWAMKVLRACLLELASSPEASGEMERIADALRTLDVIRRVELKTPA